jgi:hypothetical protein
MKSLRQQLPAILITFVLTVIGSVIFSLYQNRIQYLEYDAHESLSLLSKPNDIGDSLKFTVKGKLYKDISELDIEIYNNTNTDFKNFPIVIQFDQPDDFETISHNVLDEHKSKEWIEDLPFKSSSKYVRFGYIVKTLSRNDEPVFYAKFLVKGNTIPKYEIYSDQGGVKFKARSKSIFALASSQDLALVIIAILTIIIGVVIILMTSILLRMRKAYYYDRATARYKRLVLIRERQKEKNKGDNINIGFQDKK